MAPNDIVTSGKRQKPCCSTSLFLLFINTTAGILIRSWPKLFNNNFRYSHFKNWVWYYLHQVRKLQYKKDWIGSYCDFATGKITWSPAAATKIRPASVTEISSRARPYLIKGSAKMNIQNLWRPWNQILPLLMAKKNPSLITFTTNCSITNLKFRSLCKSNQIHLLHHQIE